MSNTKPFEWNDNTVNELLYRIHKETKWVHSQLCDWKDDFKQSKLSSTEPEKERIRATNVSFESNSNLIKVFINGNVSDVVGRLSVDKILDNMTKALNEDTVVPDIRDNEINLLKEGLWCVHKYLDELNIPRHDSKQKDYSIVGRIKLLRIQHLQELSKLESEILLSRLPEKSDTVLQDKVDSRDWEILSFKHNENIYFAIGSQGYHLYLVDYQHAIDKKFPINSVRRKSDNTVFTVGDKYEGGYKIR